MRKSALGRKHSLETIEKLKESHMGQKAWNKGIKMPDEWGNKISQALKGRKLSEKTVEKMRKKYKCEYCGKETNKSNLTRFHNSNCPKKNILRYP